MIRLIFLVFLLFSPLKQLLSQDVKAFFEFSSSKEKEFNEFYNRVDKDITQLLKEKWEMFETMHSKIEIRKFPDSPVKFDEESANQKSSGSQLIIDSTYINTDTNTDADKEEISPVKEVNIPIKTEKPVNTENEDLSEVNFFGEKFFFNENHISDLKLISTTEEEVSAFYKNITQSDNSTILRVLKVAREKYSYPDWSVYLLAKKISEQLFEDSGARAILEMYLLNKTGFDSRICRNNGRIFLMIPTSEIIYGYSYLVFEGKDYYIMGNITGPIYTYGKSTSNNLVPMNLRYNQINLPKKLISKTLNISEVKISVTVNKNLIDMLNEFPDMHFSSYCKVPFSKELEESLINNLKDKTAGMGKVDALNFLLKFVQNSFEYKTDNLQFGKERVLFADEIFHYPYSDCEDRSILFSMLVRKILQLDVALVNYPNHLATAVNLNTEHINGDYFIINGQKFIVCDPTYINAPAGESMPEIREESAKLYLLD